MIAGGNQSILLWMDKKNSYVNLRRKIPTLNESTIKRWIADVGTKQWQNTKRYVRPACLAVLRYLQTGIAETASAQIGGAEVLWPTSVLAKIVREAEPAGVGCFCLLIG